MVPSLIFVLHFHKLGLMGKRLKGAMFPQPQILQIPSEADKIASLALSKR